MTPIQPSIFTGLTAAPPGAPPPVAPDVASFADLLPGLLRPVQPRKGDAGDGKQLPATPADDEPEDSTAWIVPPVVPVICLPITVSAGEGAPVAAAGIIGIAAPSNAPFVMPGSTRPPASSASETKSAAPADETAAARPPAATPTQAALVTTPAPGLVSPNLADLLRASEGRAPFVAAPRTRPGMQSGQLTAAIVGPLRGVRLANVVPVGTVNAPAATTTSALTAEPEATSALRSETCAITAPPAEQRSAGATALRVPIVTELAALAAPRIAPAGEVFAAAIRHAVREERRAPGAHGPTLVAPSMADLAPPAVAAADTARQPTLDMHRETWPTKMIEHISALRDAADANDTSIRLIPDRLGVIDVSLKRDGERVEVNLHAHQPETRALIAEASPKLVEMGEARGLRLSTHTDGAGTGGQPQQQRSPAHSTPPPATRRAATAPADDINEQRLA